MFYISNMLYELIQSMSQSEKRYFKIYASHIYKKENRPLLKLFDLIAQQSKYNETKLKASFGGTHFAQKKMLLQYKLMNSLKSFHQGKNAHSIIDECLAEFRILLNKSIFKYAEKKLKKAKQIAENFELFTELIRIKQAETELYVATTNADTLDKHIKNMRLEIPELVQLLDKELIIENAYIHFVKANSEREFIRNKEELENLKKSTTQIFKINTEQIGSFHSKIQFYYTKGLYHYLSGDFTESLKWFKKQDQSFTEHPHINSEFQFEQARTLANISLLSIKTKSLDSFGKSYADLKNCIGKTQRLKNQINYWCYVLKFSQMVEKGDYQHAIEFSTENHQLDQLEIKFEIENILATERNLMLFGRVKSQMMLGQNKKALYLINTFLNSPHSESQQDAYILIRFLFLIIHLELENTDVVESGIRSLERYLKQKKRFFLFEETTIDLLSKLCITSNKKMNGNLWNDYRKKLSKFKQDPFERNATVNFNLVEWLELKIQ
jgi:hypothetical protein